MWLVQGKGKHKLGQTRPQDCCSTIFAMGSCCLRGSPALFDNSFRYCWRSLELNLVLLSKKNGSWFFSDNISSLLIVPALDNFQIIYRQNFLVSTGPREKRNYAPSVLLMHLLRPPGGHDSDITIAVDEVPNRRDIPFPSLAWAFVSRHFVFIV